MDKNQSRGFSAPSRYIQGPGEINNIQKYTSLFGEKAFMLIDVIFYEEFTNKFKKYYDKNDSSLLTELFEGEITEELINQVLKRAEKFKADVVVGIGGGKTLDTIKIIADRLQVPVIIVPTTASNDAPCSSMSIVYNENGTFSHVCTYIKNPDIVVVDSEIIAKAPVRFLVAGMGDAMATYFEARANIESNSPNYVNLNKNVRYIRTKTAVAMSRLCYDILKKDGLRAKLDAEEGSCTEALENVIEANILLSGIGFENVGCAGAHSLNYALSEIPQGVKILHGEKVAFGVLVQLIVEGRPMSEITEVIEFCIDVGLPVTLEDMDIEGNSKNIEIIAKASARDPLWKSEPLKVTWKSIYDSIESVNKLGHQFKEKKQ